MGLQGGFAGNRGDWLPVSQSGLVVGSGVQARAVQKSHPNPWPNSDEARKMRLTQEDKNRFAPLENKLEFLEAESKFEELF